MAAKKTKKVKFLLSPTGIYQLAYFVGDIAALPADLADELVENKYAELITKNTKNTKK